MANTEPEVRSWTKTDLEAQQEYEAEEKRILDGGVIKEILPQQTMLSESSKEMLKLGINIRAYKEAFKNQVEAIIVADKLTGEFHHIAVHWAVYDLLENWLRSEFKEAGVKFSRWRWGNWWTIRLTRRDHLRQAIETTEIALVLK